ncbi:ankyrin repeat domain-containing protein 13C-like [Oscarella lobularis]|uniref:ankyrin repeat domain-containing protein 13C-like n=1 Tax=Oscarella lobularis TaxID=121494 RepID=UPI003313E228
MSSYPLHCSVFEGDIRKVSSYCRAEDVNAKDPQGNTALHLAIALGRKECVQILLKNGASVKAKNARGWTCLEEAISYGDRQTISSLVQKMRFQTREAVEKRRPHVSKILKQIPDFYLEVKWDFQSWIPLVSRMLPSDLCKIYKKGACLRMDTTLVDFSDMKWQRGDLSFIYNGELSCNGAVMLLDNQLKVYQKMRERLDEVDLEDEVDFLMSTDMTSVRLSTKPIHFTRSQSGWFFRTDRTDKVGPFEANVYDVHGVSVVTRKRREHLSEEDIQRNKAFVETFTKGCTKNPFSQALPRRQSLLPPEPSGVTWRDYIESSEQFHFGRPVNMKEDRRNFRASIAICQNFPISVNLLLDLLEIMFPFKQFGKLKELVELKLPSGFPIKAEVPVLPTITAKVTFQEFSLRDDINVSLFLVPRDYKENQSRFPEI